ncbi:hypothetical protein GQ464_017655 [Rhodocaloribacter litoris]|uniref:hypothetical protein n=1 Tax=Rhodocaloribacter litoris TaxID=2558931 RepID=UPI00141E4A8A|nr:hypothetical protein [Rhodocaloribacter litoris]QXD15204.1 hypothetical protein GQ464_017655 [Rhodocaloribacter litoris]
MRHVLLLWLLGLLPACAARAQVDTTTVQDALYDRPFIGAMAQTAIGGYLEGNTNYFSEDGIAEGFSMEVRRFNVFLFSAISERVRLISELEFEHGTEEINLETALLDFRIGTGLVLRGGILLPPIGAFNQNHDAPLWEFVDRPLVSTEIIPATLSEPGFGVYGKLFRGALAFTYDVYLTNGLGDGVLLNGEGRTHLPSGKREDLFAEDNNGSPALSGRLAVRDYRLGEVGLSYYGGVYNTYRRDGEAIDVRRRLHLVAVDLDGEVGPVALRGEVAWAFVDVPAALREFAGHRQWGGYLDVVVPVGRWPVLGYEDAVFNANLRLERVDFNVGTFASTGAKIHDEVEAIVLGLSFRPTPETVFRANYRYRWERDRLGNPAVRTAGFQFGLATYF